MNHVPFNVEPRFIRYVYLVVVVGRVVLVRAVRYFYRYVRYFQVAAVHVRVLASERVHPNGLVWVVVFLGFLGYRLYRARERG